MKIFKQKIMKKKSRIKLKKKNSKKKIPKKKSGKKNLETSRKIRGKNRENIFT